MKLVKLYNNVVLVMYNTNNNNTIVAFSMLKIYLIFVFSSIGQYLTRAWLQQKKTRFMKQMNYLNYTTFIYSKTYIMSRNVFGWRTWYCTQVDIIRSMAVSIQASVIGVYTLYLLIPLVLTIQTSSRQVKCVCSTWVFSKYTWKTTPRFPRESDWTKMDPLK